MPLTLATKLLRMALLLGVFHQYVEDPIDRGVVQGIFGINPSLSKVLVTIFVGKLAKRNIICVLVRLDVYFDATADLDTPVHTTSNTDVVDCSRHNSTACS